MTASDRLLKKNQSNFLASNFREFYKLWRDNQEANLTVKCCDGKLSIIFESSFQSPEIKPTLQTIVKRKVKRTSPSRRRRNQARAEQFRRNKAFKDNADEMPASSKDGQKEMQASVSSKESASEKLLSATAVPADIVTRNPEALFTGTPIGEGPPDPTDDAENSLPVSRVKRKAKRRQDERIKATVNEKPEATVETSEMSAARVEAQLSLDIRQTQELFDLTKRFLDSIVDDVEERVNKRVKDGHVDPKLCDDLDKLSGSIKKFGEGGFPIGKEDEGRRALVSYERRIQCLLQKFHRTEQPRARASSVCSYKGRASAKSQKGKKR